MYYYNCILTLLYYFITCILTKLEVCNKKDHTHLTKKSI